MRLPPPSAPWSDPPSHGSRLGASYENKNGRHAFADLEGAPVSRARRLDASGSMAAGHSALRTRDLGTPHKPGAAAPQIRRCLRICKPCSQFGKNTEKFVSLAHLPIFLCSASCGSKRFLRVPGIVRFNAKAKWLNHLKADGWRGRWQGTE